MKLSKSIFCAVPVQEWNNYIRMPFPLNWCSVVKGIEESSISSITWLSNFIVCAELPKGEEIIHIRSDLKPDAIRLSTDSDLRNVLKNKFDKSFRIASCGCCLILTLTKE